MRIIQQKFDNKILEDIKQKCENILGCIFWPRKYLGKRRAYCCGNSIPQTNTGCIFWTLISLTLSIKELKINWNLECSAILKKYKYQIIQERSLIKWKLCEIEQNNLHDDKSIFLHCMCFSPCCKNKYLITLIFTFWGV